MEQGKDWRWAPSGAPAGERGTGAGRWRIGGCSFLFSYVVEGCMVAWLHRAQADVLDQVRRRRSSLGPVVASSGGGGSQLQDSAGLCRTKAGAGLALAHGRCGSPRTAGWRTRGCAGRERQKQRGRKNWTQVGAWSLMGTPRAVVGAARAVVVGTLSGS